MNRNAFGRSCFCLSARGRARNPAGRLTPSRGRAHNRAVQRSGIEAPVAMVRRIVASEDAIAEAAAEVFPLAAGRVCRQRRFPHVFDANVVRHPRLDGGSIDRDLALLASPLRAIGARHLQIACDGAPLSDAIITALRDRGFVRDRLLAMVLPGAPARDAARDVAVRAIADDAPSEWYERTMDRLSREEPWYTPLVAREIIDSLETKAAAGALDLFVAVRAGEPVGAVGLALGARETAGVAAIVTVGTVPEARGRGVGQTMVVRLAERARAAGCDLVYLIARAADTPKDMYRKLGFAVAFGFDVWLRPPA
jgi:ribosomal protein S18 acetylase RimI-like enzyme